MARWSNGPGGIKREINYLDQSKNILAEEKRNLLLEAEKYNINVLKEDELTDEIVKSEIESTKNEILLLDKSITLKCRSYMKSCLISKVN